MPANQPDQSDQSNQIGQIIDLIHHRAPACGSTKIVSIDGPNAAGKSTLASVLAGRLEAHVLSMVGIYRGLTGLNDGIDVLVDDVLKAIAIGEPGRHREWNWGRQTPGAFVDTPAAPIVIVDGAGSGARRPRIFSSVLVWVDADAQRRRERALRRDGDELDAWWDIWNRHEQQYFASQGPEAAADLRIRTDPVA